MKHSFFTKERPLRIGTDCSGMEAPIVALQQLRIPFSHEFSSEIDTHCIATIQANFTPKIIFGDMKTRDIRDVPDIDLYVCGFPCQPFSMAGKRQGERDPRGTIFYECLRVIRHKKPMVFVLENVRGLLSIDGGQTFKTILRELEKLKVYNVRWKVLNTADYGIPQSRKRVFIVGIMKRNENTEFRWPEPIPCRPLEEFVDWDDKHHNDLPQFIKTKNVSNAITKQTAIFVNLTDVHNYHRNANRLCPCILTCNHNYYCVPMKRYINKYELLKLQGFSVNFMLPVSKSQWEKQLGNTISVNVLVHLFKNIFQRLEPTLDTS
jgi:DNA (cytosine-5)-methyltransferase 1